MRVASAGPARTTRPAASAVQRQRSSFFAPPPTRWISSSSRPVSRASRSTLAACFRARLSKMQRTTDPSSAGCGCPVRRAVFGDPRRHVAGLGEHWVVRVDEGTQRLRRPGQRDEVVDRVGPSGERPRTRAFLQQPEPGDVAEDPEGVLDAALVRHVCAKGLVGQHRFARLDSDERPGTDDDVGRTVGPQRDAGDGGGRVVGRGRNDRGVAETRLLRDVFQQRSERGARRDDLGEQLARNPRADRGRRRSSYRFGRRGIASSRRCCAR